MKWEYGYTKSIYTNANQEEVSDKFWMVTGAGNNPKIRHTSYESAEKEAIRLKEQHPDVDFFVLQSVGKVEAVQAYGVNAV